MKDTAYIDMDDTACNFSKAYRIAIAKEPGIIYPQSQLKFFENLEPIEDFVDAYFKLKTKFNVFLLSRPSIFNPLSYTEKRLWVEKYLGFDECGKMMLACDKTLVRGKYLIDDCEQTGLLVPEWEHIVFGGREFPNWKAVLNYLM